MKNKFLFSIIIVISLTNSYSQDSLEIKTNAGTIKTADINVIEYNQFLHSLNKNDYKNIQSAIKYFNEKHKKSDSYNSDLCALLFQKFYIGFKYYYSDSYESANKDSIEIFNNNLEDYGLIISEISEGDDLYILPKSGFLSKCFQEKISQSLYEYFYLYDLTIKLRYIYNNSNETNSYIQVLEEILIRSESLISNYTPPLNKQYLNKFYIKHLALYINMSNDFGYDLYATNKAVNPSFYDVYKTFLVKCSNTMTCQFISALLKIIDEHGELPDLTEFFYSFNYNDYGIPEIRKELNINTLIKEFTKFIENI